MAKQSSLLKIEGRLEELSFYRTRDGHLVRMKGGVDGNRIATDPRFARTRENGQEFGHAAKSGKLLRLSLKSGLQRASDSKVTSRLTKIMRQLLVFDGLNDRGARQVSEALLDANAVAMLKGFDFNAQAGLSGTLSLNPVVDLSKGEISFSNLNPATDIKWPAGATHVVFQSIWTVVDFSSGVFAVSESSASRLAKTDAAQALSLTPPNAPGGNGVNFVALLLDFYQMVNGQYYSINNKSYNVLNLLDLG